MGVTLQQGLQRAAHGSVSEDVVPLLAGGGGGGGGGDGGGGNSGPQGNHPEISTRDLPVSSFSLLHSALQGCLWQNHALRTDWLHSQSPSPCDRERRAESSPPLHLLLCIKSDHNITEHKSDKVQRFVHALVLTRLLHETLLLRTG